MPLDLASKIKLQRETKRYSQEFMAARLNITQASYSRLESGHTKPNVERLLTISEILGVNILYFIGQD